MLSLRISRAASSGLVLRPVIFDRLEGGAAGPVTVVAAPAGSGKTVVVRSWLEANETTHLAAWVSVDRHEHDAQRFWSAVVSELRAKAPRGAVTSLAPTPVFDGVGVVRRLVSELGSLEQKLILVIDDLHEIADGDILTDLTYFLDHLPDTIHIVLIGRRDPQLGLHRRKLEGSLTEIRSSHLNFTLDETREMMTALKITLSDENLGLLHDRTEGWVAGLRLAAMSLAAHPDPERFVSEFSGSERSVAEYLLAEVLDRQPEDVRQLLTRTSLLARVNGELGDLLTGSSGAERHLKALADAGEFVIALDTQRTWFRYHHLLADLLAAELRYSEPEEIPRLHRAAATWHAEHEYVIEAIVHAQAGGANAQAEGLLLEHYFSLTLDGRQATAHALLEGFSRDSSVAAPELALVTANDQLVEGSLDQAAAHLALAERHADAVPENRRRQFKMALLVTRLSHARRIGDLRAVADEARTAASLAEPDDGRDIAVDNDVRTLMLMNLGIAEVWSGRREDGARHLTAARDLARRTARPYLEVSCQAHWAQALVWESFIHAGKASREAIALAETYGWGADPVIGPALVTLAVSQLHAGQIEDGERWLSRAREVLRPDLEPAVGFMLHSAHALTHYLRGRYREAISSAREAEQLDLALITGSPLASQLRCLVLHARLGLGEIDAVRNAIAEMPEADRELGEVREVRGMLAAVDGDPEAAISVLALTINDDPGVHRPHVVLRSLLRTALAHDVLGRLSAVEDALERALDLAEPDALIAPFLHTASVELLGRHPRHRTAHGAFIAEIGDVLCGRSTTGPTRAPASPLIEGLSDAELRVLRFLPTNLLAPDIASEIYVSVNTVKTHMRHIYAKLGAHSRVEAVERARELELLGPSAHRR